jgi:hypothetical protein
VPIAEASLESAERVGVTDSTTLPVEPIEANVLEAVGVTDSTTLTPVEPTEEDGDELLEADWILSDDVSLEVGCTIEVGTSPLEATEEGGVGSTLSEVTMPVEATVEGAVGSTLSETTFPVEAPVEGAVVSTLSLDEAVG